MASKGSFLNQNPFKAGKLVKRTYARRKSELKARPWRVKEDSLRKDR